MRFKITQRNKVGMIENAETSETSEFFFRGFPFPRFRSSNVPRSKTRKLRKIFDLIFDFFRSPKMGHFPRFPRFRSSNVPRSKTRKLRKLLRFRRPEKVKNFPKFPCFRSGYVPGSKTRKSRKMSHFRRPQKIKN